MESTETRLKNLICEKFSSVKDFASRIDVPYTTLDSILRRGVENANVRNIIKICDALDIDVDALAAGQLKSKIKLPFNFSPAEQEHVKKYRTLDRYGKEAVDSVLKVEHTRCTTLTEETESNVIYFNTPEYLQPVSAGTGDWIDDDSFRNLLLTKQPPRGTSFLVRVHGDSMEPTYCDGDRLFIRSQNTLEDGQIGIFCTNGEMFVKELRGGRLMSHNKTYKPIPLTEDTYCQGRVLGVCTEDYFEE